MVDSILDEALLVKCLKQEVIPENARSIMDGALAAVVDGYDRKVTRDEFMVLLSTSMTAYGAFARLACLKSLEISWKAEKVDAVALKTAEDYLTTLAKENISALTEFVERLVQCPNTGDKVH